MEIGVGNIREEKEERAEAIRNKKREEKAKKKREKEGVRKTDTDVKEGKLGK